ncbi:T9SS type A sorting domain-containing protein [Moheibacter stercoris]|uniref:Por secretion system C-terminal sorting domain-containing protein n=1 Tax=Moheibacter stercoris TaxID=1628251 RepID=A0ABV2LQH2_9FLAO
MKNKFLLFFTTLLLAVTQLWGQSETLDCPLGTIENNAMTFVTDNFTIIHAKGESNNFAAYSPWRVYTDNTVTFTGGENVQNITSVVITATNASYAQVANDSDFTVLSGTGTFSSSVSGNIVTINITGEDVTSIQIKPNAQTRWESITLNFQEAETSTTYNLTVTQPTGGSISPEGVIEVEEGGSAEFTATASECYTFNHWLIDGANAGNTNPYVFTNVTEDHTITAVFDTVAPYAITATAGTNGSISPSGDVEVNCGEDQTFNITADAGYIVSDVLVDGVSVGAVSTYTFTEVSADHTISATFEAIEEPGDFCFEEGFDGLTDIPTGTNYGSGTYTNNGITWDFHGQSPLPNYAIDGQGILLRRASDSFLETTIPAGVGTFSFEYRKAYTSGTSRQLELIVNGTQVATTPEFGSGSGDQTTVYTFTHEINSEEPVVIRIKLSGEESTNRHATIDNISWTCEDVVPCETPAPTAEAQEFCAGATVADLVAEGIEIKWYATADATEALEGTVELVSGTYYVSQTIGDCESDRVAVEVTINEIPAAPVAEATQIFTEGQTLADLVVEGENLTWYDADGNELPETTVLVDGTTYYVSQSINGCESEQTAITVELEVETGDACFEEGFTDLTEIATGSQYAAGTYTNNGITWDFHGQSPLPNYAIDGQGILLRRASDSFLETTIPAGVGTFSFEYRKAYTGGAARQLEFIVDGEIVGTTEVFGEGSGEQTTVYTFTHEINSEEPVVVRIKLSGEESTNRHATIDNISWTCIEVEPCDLPAPTAEDQEFCAGATVADLVAEGTEIKWYASLESTEALASTEVLVAGSYFATQTIDNCESEKTEVVVTLLETPEAPIADSPQIFTEGQTLADLVVEGENLTWYDADGNELAETTVLVDGTTYYVTSSNEICESEQTEILVQLEGNTEDPCFEEGFDNLTEIATGSQYAEGTYTNNGVTWNFFAQSPLDANGGDYSIDGQGILLRRASDGYLEGNLPAGVGVFSFEYRKAYTGGAARQLEFIVDGEIVGTTEVFGEGSGEQTTVYTFTHEINSEEPVVVRIKLSGEESTNRHATIDNISWTCIEVEPCDLPAPTAESPQQFTAGQTLADLVVEGENLTWYDVDGNELPETTLLVDGARYYVTSSNDVCESDATSIEVYLEDLGNGAINFANFNYYPNPVKNKLNIINANEITEVSIYNLAGALVAKQITSSKSVEINLSSVSTGTYIVKVISGKETKSFKIIKK